jgi:hypothetical protein
VVQIHRPAGRGGLDIERNDNTDSRIIWRQFDVAWPNLEICNIILNKGFLSVQTCGDHSQGLAINQSYLETPQPTTILTDKVTEAKVSKILEKNIFEPPLQRRRLGKRRGGQRHTVRVLTATAMSVAP